jgi:hypothetical protein
MGIARFVCVTNQFPNWNPLVMANWFVTIAFKNMEQEYEKIQIVYSSHHGSQTQASPIWRWCLSGQALDAIALSTFRHSITLPQLVQGS